MAVRIFLATFSDLMSAMRRSGPLHLVQRISKPNVFLNSSAQGMYLSAQGMYLDLLVGLSNSAGSGRGVGGGGTTSLREAACEESTPK